jgi:mRNA interferase RelE/StbE
VYELLIERSAERDLNKLPAQVFREIVPRIRALSANPRPPGCCKLSGSERAWRIRMGVFRVVYEIDDKARVVRVMMVRHRREVYR